MARSKLSLMSPSSCCELWGGCHGCIELSRVQITEILVGQDIGKADHRVQWRSQLVRDIGNEFALQAAGCFKCVVALAQYPFVLRRVSHIEVGPTTRRRRGAGQSPPAKSSRHFDGPGRSLRRGW